MGAGEASGDQVPNSGFRIRVPSFSTRFGILSTLLTSTSLSTTIEIIVTLLRQIRTILHHKCRLRYGLGIPHAPSRSTQVGKQVLLSHTMSAVVDLCISIQTFKYPVEFQRSL